MKVFRMAALTLALSLVTGACGSDGGGTTSPSGDGHDHVHGQTPTPGGTFAFGQPGNVSEATQTIKIEATDALRFDPASIEVKTGDTIVFEVTNSGSEDHEFVLGDLAFQESHAKMMSGGGPMSHGEVNAVSLPPGEKVILAWKFTVAGEWQYACHTNGHYGSGMFGKVVVA